MYHDDPYQYHYQSRIPLAPGNFPRPSNRRTSFSPPITQHGVFIQDYPSPTEYAPESEVPSHLTPRPDRPDVPCTPQPDTTPQMGGSSSGGFQPQPDHDYLLPSLATISPPRPRRPSQPDRARMFNSPVPLDGQSSASSSADTHRPFASTSTSAGAFPHPPTGSSLPPPPSLARRHSSHRKPVPKFIPDPAPGSPFSGVRVEVVEEENIPPSQRSHSPRSLNRLSISGFEALLQRGVAPSAIPSHLLQQQRREDGGEEDGQIVWSPRIHLGLDPEGVEARDERLRRDRTHPYERDLGDRAGFVAETEQDEETTPRQPPPRKRTTFDSHPAVVVGPTGGVEPRTPPRTTATGGAGGGRETGSIRRFLTPKSAKSKRSRMTSYDPQYSDDDGEGGEEQEDVEVVSEGPVLRRGSKRLSELPLPREGRGGGDEDDEAEKSSAASSSAQRLVQAYRGKGRKPSVLSKPPPSSRRSREKVPSAKAAPPVEEVEVVVHDSATGSEDEKDGGRGGVVEGWNEMEGDWEKIRRETTCRPERMNWSMVAFEGRFPRLLHLLYPFAIFAHIPMTLFLDYNLLYLLCQLALYPSLPSTLLRNIATRALVDVPDIKASTGWWVAVGIYAACTAGWFFGVFLWQEIGRELLGKWGGGGKRVEIEKVYCGAASFNLACVRSYDIFSFLWRVRLAPVLPKSVLAQAVEGTKWTDGVKETLAWYSQNWPTVLLLIPRAGLSVAILLLYSTTAYGSSAEITIARDTAYFGGDGTLTRFASGVLFANAAWGAWRLLVYLVALIGFWLVDRPSFFHPFSKRDDPHFKYYHPSRDHLTISSPLPLLDGKSGPFTPSSPARRRSITLATWYTRRQRRLRAAILACLGSTPLSLASPTFSPFLHSPYMFGLSPSVSGGKSAFSNVRPAKPWDDEKAAAAEEDRRRANLSLGGQGATRVVDHEAGPMMASPRAVDSLWRTASRYVIPAPALPTSPLISFSPATPPHPAGQFEGPTPLLGQTSGVQPRRRESHAAGAGVGETGDLGESQLHRRVRSLPHNNSSDALDHSAVIRFDAVSPSSLPYVAPGPPVLPPLATRPSSHLLDTSPPTRPLLRPANSGETSSSSEPFDPNATVRPGAGAARPPLVSHFSAFSSAAPSSAQPSPAVDRFPPFSRNAPSAAPDMSRQSTSSSFASPMPAAFLSSSSRQAPLPPRRPSPSPACAAWNPTTSLPAAAVLDSRLTLSGSSSAEPSPSLSLTTERENLSARLLDEVQRLHEAEAALAREERRIDGLRRISEATSAGETARTARTTLSTSGEEEEEDYATAESPEEQASSSSTSSGLVELAAAAQQQPAAEEAEGEVDPRRFSESSAWSQPSSVGGMSESSTLRGAVRTPDAMSTLGAFPFPRRPNEENEEDEEERPNLAPFRLSYGPDADGLSLSAYGSPDMAGSETGRFEGSPVVGRPE